MIETLVSLWLTVMLTFARGAPQERLATVARAVVEATSDPQEQALLLTVSLYETGFGRSGIPFGISSVNRTGERTLLQDAQASLRILRRSVVQCGRSLPFLLGRYHHGNGCRPDSYSIREAETVRRMMSRYNDGALRYNEENRVTVAPLARPVPVYAANTRRTRRR
jgi:hypothetical protein